MKHKLNSKGQAGTTADSCKIAENLMSSQPIANAIVCLQVSCHCDESRSLDGRRGATFTIKPVACCVALRGKVVNDATGASVRAERIVKRL